MSDILPFDRKAFQIENDWVIGLIPYISAPLLDAGTIVVVVAAGADGIPNSLARAGAAKVTPMAHAETVTLPAAALVTLLLPYAPSLPTSLSHVQNPINLNPRRLAHRLQSILLILKWQHPHGVASIASTQCLLLICPISSGSQSQALLLQNLGDDSVSNVLCLYLQPVFSVGLKDPEQGKGLSQ